VRTTPDLRGAGAAHGRWPDPRLPYPRLKVRSGLRSRSPLRAQHQHRIKSAGGDKPIHEVVCCGNQTPLPAGRVCPQWIDSGPSCHLSGGAV